LALRKHKTNCNNARGFELGKMHIHCYSANQTFRKQTF